MLQGIAAACGGERGKLRENECEEVKILAKRGKLSLKGHFEG
jgi:hypothetical protein